MHKVNRRLGVHTSIAGSLPLSLERAKALGCTTMQIFSHNPRQWQVEDIPEEQVAHFKRIRNVFDIHPVFVHTSYLINLAALNHSILLKSVHLLIRELGISLSKVCKGFWHTRRLRMSRSYWKHQKDPTLMIRGILK